VAKVRNYRIYYRADLKTQKLAL